MPDPDITKILILYRFTIKYGHKCVENTSMENKILTKRRDSWRPYRRIVAGLVLYCCLSGPLWAPPGGGRPAGWCRNQTTLSPIANLSFGDFSGNDVGLVNVTIGGVRTASGGVVLMGGTVSQAMFTVAGCANYTYSIILPPNTTLSAGTDTMTVTTFQSYPVGSGILDANGDGVLQLGATLNTGFLQPAGPYSGTYTVEIVIQ